MELEIANFVYAPQDGRRNTQKFKSKLQYYHRLTIIYHDTRYNAYVNYLSVILIK